MTFPDFAVDDGATQRVSAAYAEAAPDTVRVMTRAGRTEEIGLLYVATLASCFPDGFGEGWTKAMKIIAVMTGLLIPAYTEVSPGVAQTQANPGGYLADVGLNTGSLPTENWALSVYFFYRFIFWGLHMMFPLYRYKPQKNR